MAMSRDKLIPVVRQAIALALCIACAMAAHAASQQFGLHDACEKSEQTVFSCRNNAKLALLCASEAGRHPIYMQYRFSSGGQIEIRHPRNKRSLQDAFHISSVSYSGGGETHVRFLVNRYSYIIYDRTISGDRDADGKRFPHFDSGIVVKKNGKPIRHIQCANAALAGIHSVAYETLQKERYEDLGLR